MILTCQLILKLRNISNAFLKDIPKFKIPYSFFFKTKAKNKAAKKAKNKINLKIS
jgi:hypothetical protein